MKLFFRYFLLVAIGILNLNLSVNAEGNCAVYKEEYQEDIVNTGLSEPEARGRLSPHYLYLLTTSDSLSDKEKYRCLLQLNYSSGHEWSGLYLAQEYLNLEKPAQLSSILQPLLKTESLEAHFIAYKAIKKGVLESFNGNGKEFYLDYSYKNKFPPAICEKFILSLKENADNPDVKSLLEAANLEEERCQYYLAISYLNGDFTEKDIELSEKWARKSIENGLVSASSLLQKIKRLKETKQSEK